MKRYIASMLVLLILSCAFGVRADDGQIGIVKAEQDGNIRSSAGSSSVIIGKTSNGMYYSCYGEKNGWYLIRTEDGTEGYVSGRYIVFYRTAESDKKKAYKLSQAKKKDIEIGDVVLFGNYEQDNNKKNGKEPIEWIVLEKTKDSILMISRYGIERQRFHNENNPTVWEKSALRKWLNETFFTAAFTKNEQEKIILTKLHADTNTEYSVKCGKETDDHVFLLSISEVKKYLTKDTSACVPTAYAIAHNGSYNQSTGFCWWWLRTSGHDRMHVSYVNEKGAVSAYGYGVISKRGVVRPAIQIRIK